MTHPIHRITGFECVAPYSLHLRFEDGVEKVVDLADVLEGELYGPLRDPFLFSRVALDSEVGTVVWPNGADFDPATLHEWPRVSAELAARASAWAEATSEPRANTALEPTARN